VPCHHSLDEYLATWVGVAGIDEKGSLFGSFKKGDKLTGNPIIRNDVFLIIKRRARGAARPIPPAVIRFRATGIAAYLRTAAGSNTLNRSRHISRHGPQSSLTGRGRRFRSMRPSESNSKVVL
jgi:hypothetical protein